MSGYFVNGGLENLFVNGLNGETGYNDTAAMCTSATAFSGSSTYSSVGVDTTTNHTVQYTWTFTLTGSVLTASVTVTFVSPGGGTYYGFGIYSSTGNVLMYAENFTAPQTLAAGGSYVVGINLQIEMCP